MIDALNTKAGMILAGALAVILLASWGYVGFTFHAYLGWVAVAEISILVALLNMAIVVAILRLHRAPVVVYDKKDRLARVVDGQVLERDLYPASLTNLTTHYDPRINTRNEPVALPPAVEVAPALPGPMDLLQVLQTFTPSPERILLGLSPTGPITCTIKGLSHIALAAPTGGGKSAIVRLLEAQLLALRLHVWHCDIHFTPYDPETGEDWRPIAARLAQPPFTSARQIAHLLSSLVEEKDRRYALRALGQHWGPPGWAIVEELPGVLAALPKEERNQVVKDYGILLREARKVGLYLLVVSQDWQVETVGVAGQSELIENILTAFFLGGGLTTAKAILDRQVQLPEGVALGRGVAMLRNVEAQPIPALARVPYASNEALYRLLSPAPLQPTSFSLAPVLPPLPPKAAPPARERKPLLVSAEEEQQIRDLTAKGMSPAGIARAMKRAGAFADVVRLVLDEAGKIASEEV